MSKRKILVKCPRCKKESVYDVSNSHRPFCSRACKNVDFVNWVEEKYVVSDSETKEDEDLDQNRDENGLLDKE